MKFEDKIFKIFKIIGKNETCFLFIFTNDAD